MNADKLEQKIKIDFKNKKLLEQVLVHRSYLNENRDFELDNNERLEFLGDAVLELIVTRYLYKNYDNPEGELTNLRSALVRGKMLAELAEKFDIGKLLYLSRGEDKSQGRTNQLLLANAFEALIEPYTGDMYAEPGPNMMWNTKYGMMSGMMWGDTASSDELTVTEKKAQLFAQEFIDVYLPGAKTENPDQFYGYYTLHVLRDGEIYGMLSVNGYTGQVWYHSWHGRFLDMIEFHEH